MSSRKPARKGSPAAFETLNRVDPDEDFSDVDGDPKNEFELDSDSEDPTRHYHWAHNSPDDIGQYTGGVLQYRVEKYADGGVKPRMLSGLEVGQTITKRDHVLVSCDRALYEKRLRYERKKTQQTNDQMFKSRQRTVVAGDHRGELDMRE